jgi:IS5 family transposase
MISYQFIIISEKTIMAPTTKNLEWTLEPLFWVAPDTDMKKVLDQALDLAARKPEILSRIATDQDALGIAKKRLRLADQRWERSQMLPLPGLSVEETTTRAMERVWLLEGRPRMSAEAVYVFSVLRGYLGSISDQEVRDHLLDSITLQLYLRSRNLTFPGWTTILENLNAISPETRDFILKAQLEQILEEELDDFSQALLDSTAVEANSRWPTDAGILLALLERAFGCSQKLETFGLVNVPKWWMPQWLKKLHQLHFRINNIAGKPKSKGKLKKYYRQFLRTVEKMLDYLISECIGRDPLQEAAPRPPSQLVLLERMWDQLVRDISEVGAVYQYTQERLFEGKQRPAEAKKLSVSDESAAFIKKGQRIPVIGYKPQLARSGEGFVTTLRVPQGNAADAPQLVSLIEDVHQHTGILPQQVSVDDGYASEAGRNKLLEAGVKEVSISGAKGKKLTPEEDWNSTVHQLLRKGRSAVESLIFVLKFRFAFGRLRRRGLEEVRAELGEKIIAYNFARMVFVRKAREEIPLDQAA